MLIKTFKENTIGRDFFTTDIHGSFDLLHEQMRLNAFDTSKDRLFVGGDLCDRGLYSSTVLDYIHEPWLHSVQANHEAMVIQAYEDEFKGRAAEMLYFNGGEWYFDCPPSETTCYL